MYILRLVLIGIFNNVPAGTPLGGFIPYLHITAKVTNEKSGLSTFIDLTSSH